MVARSRVRAWVLRLGAVALGLCLVGAAEVALRASGRWAAPPAPAALQDWASGARLVASEDHPRLTPTTVGGLPGWRTDPALVQQRFMHDQRWTTAPPTDAQRVFVFGGSTTYGVPVEAQPELTFPGRMAAWLTELGVPAEVVNLGGASFGSDQVLTLATAVAEHGADVMVVYSANNEFFQYDLALYRRNQRYPTTRARFQLLHLFRALDGLFSPPPSTALDQAVDRQRQVVGRVIEASLAQAGALPTRSETGQWQRNDPHYSAVVGRYRSNLRDLEIVAETARARLLLVDVPANLQQAPWLSLHRPTLSTLSRRRVAQLLLQGAASLAADDPESALATAQDALSIDPMYAASWYALGMAHQQLAQLDAAEDALRSALELDMDPGRPVAALGRIVRETTADGGSELVDLTPLVEAPDSGPFGRDLFHDSCHLTEAAYDRVGRHLAMAIRLGG